MGVIVAVAGKTNNQEVDVLKLRDQPACAFNDSGNTAYFSWSTSATISKTKRSSDSVVLYQNYTGDAIMGCTKCPVAFVGIKAAAAALALTGWKFSLIFFSWGDVKPTSVFWDPTLGSDTIDPNVAPANPPSSPSLGTMTAPLWWVTLCVIVVHLWNLSQ